MMFQLKKRRMGRSRMVRWLDDLNTDSDQYVTACFPRGLSQNEFQDFIIEHINLESISLDIFKPAFLSKTGVAILWGTDHKFIIIPPFSIEAKSVPNYLNIDMLRSVIFRDLVIGIVLLRLGEYAIAVSNGQSILSDKCGKGLVHSRHKKGGSSQRRFERHRDKQIEMFFSRVCAHVHEKLEPYSAEIDHLVYGGERNTLRTFRNQCSYLKEFDSRTLDLIINVRNPNRNSLVEAIETTWQTDLYELIEDEPNHES